VRPIFVDGPAAFGKLTAGRDRAQRASVALFLTRIAVDPLTEQLRSGDSPASESKPSVQPPTTQYCLQQLTLSSAPGAL
jgi:hypothetical protein